MATRRKRRSKSPLVLFTIAVIVLAVGAYLKSQSETGIQAVSGADSNALPAEPSTPEPELTANHAALSAAGSPSVPAAAATGVAAATGTVTRPPVAGNPHEAARLLKLGRDALANDGLVAARTRFVEALAVGPSDGDADVIREALAAVCDETIFSNRILPDDPLTDAYVIQTGDSLAKIAKRHNITDDLLARINGIEDKSRIRAGRRIKIIHGPFHATVSKSTFDLDLYLQDTCVRRYKVGLGADGSTPTGEWICTNKLVNPQFYPPRGGVIIPGGDPKNPLGTRWIGLKGMGGDAVGQERYGLHGTIAPDSIGKNCSMGCIRMHNEDVELLYELLVADNSRVSVRE